MSKQNKPSKSESLLILEQLSAAIDAEDKIPNQIFDKNHELNDIANKLWKTQSLVNSCLQKSNNDEFVVKNNLKSIMDKIQDIPDISTELNIDKIAKIKELSLISKAKDISSKRFNIIHYIKNNSKSWFGLAFSIGITATFMGLSISTHNMELFSPKSSIYPTSNLKSNANGLSLSNADEEKQINRYLNAHQKSDTHAYGLVNIASSEDSEDNYVDNYIFKTLH